MTETIWLDGRFTKADKPLISHHDTGFSRGLGVFDTMLGRDGEPVKTQAHFDRLVHDCRTCLLYDPLELGWFSLSWFADTARGLMKINGLSSGRVRIRTQITAGITAEVLARPQSPLCLMSVTQVHETSHAALIRAAIIDGWPRIAGCTFENSKRLDYTRSYYAKHAAAARGAGEAILTNTEGNIACGVTSNLMILERDRLVTPPLRDGVLNGITRKTIVANKGAAEESISADRLLTADAVFFVNSILGVRPISAIDNKEFAISVPEQVERLQKLAA